MKRFLLLSTALFLCVFLLTNLTVKSVSSFIFSSFGEAPNLPNTPYAYDDIEFPAHLLAANDNNENPIDSFDTGYGSGGVDSSSFALVTNDGATLGRVLFYDKKLSALENISCASCHIQSLSFTENKKVSDGISSPTRRNSMQLNDIAWTNNEFFFWDMSQSNLHEMVRLPLTDANEVGANIDEIASKLFETSYYPDLFTKAFGDPLVTEERVVDALVQFVMSMTTFNSRFDQEASIGFANFNEKEMRGKELFGKNCSSCHSQGEHTLFGGIIPEEEPILFVAPFLFNNGLPEDPNDKGAGEWEENFKNLFKIPSLRNIELTAPYMHDGRFETLEEVMDHYSDEIVQNEWTAELLPPEGFKFSDDDKAALVAFLKTLTDESFITNPKWSDPFDIINSTETLEFDNLIIRPNPMQEQALIEFDNQQNEMVSMNIFTVDGKLIRHDNTRTNQFILNKKEFTSGTYFIELIMGAHHSTKKLMVR